MGRLFCVPMNTLGLLAPWLLGRQIPLNLVKGDFSGLGRPRWDGCKRAGQLHRVDLAAVMPAHAGWPTDDWRGVLYIFNYR